MTNLERKLVKMLNDKGLALYKYHAKDESDDIPDILDYLYNARDRINSQRSQLALIKAKGLVDWYTMADYTRLTSQHIKVLALINQTLTGSEVYYGVYCAGHDLAPSVYPLQKTSPHLYKAAVNGSKVSYIDTGDVVDVYKSDYMKTYILDTSSTNILLSRRFKGTEYLYIDPVDVSKDDYFKCKDCGKWFCLTDSEMQWYRNKGFSVPKRCKTCRDTRRWERESTYID